MFRQGNFVELWKHQKEAVDLLAKTCIGALFMEMGTGKTRTIIELIRLNPLLRVLILTPLVVVRQWREEFRKYAPELLAMVGCAEGAWKKRLAVLAAFQIVIINHDALASQNTFDGIIAFKPDMLVVDESTRFKNPWATRSQRVVTLADKTPRKYLLTGRPVLNSSMDLFQQVRILSPDLLGKNFFQFRNTYFYDKNSKMPKLRHFPDWQPKPKTEEKLQTILSTFAIVKKKADVLDLPPLVRIIQEVELSKEQAAIYNAMERDMIAHIGDNRVMVAQLTMEKFMRLQQIACGIAKDVEGKIKYLDTGKEAATLDLLDDLAGHHKFILWTHFEPNYARLAGICHKLSLDFVTIIGGQGANARDNAVKSFMNDKNVRVCIANQAAGGIGIGLQAASYMVYYSKSQNLEHDVQSEARAYRGGSEIHNKITRIDLNTRGTIEEDIHVALAEKLSLSDLFLNLKKRKTNGSFSTSGTGAEGLGFEAGDSGGGSGDEEEERSSRGFGARASKGVRGVGVGKI